jgi:hypothetical protein
MLWALECLTIGQNLAAPNVQRSPDTLNANGKKAIKEIPNCKPTLTCLPYEILQSILLLVLPTRNSLHDLLRLSDVNDHLRAVMHNIITHRLAVSKRRLAVRIIEEEAIRVQMGFRRSITAALSRGVPRERFDKGLLDMALADLPADVPGATVEGINREIAVMKEWMKIRGFWTTAKEVKENRSELCPRPRPNLGEVGRMIGGQTCRNDVALWHRDQEERNRAAASARGVDIENMDRWIQ